MKEVIAKYLEYLQSEEFLAAYDSELPQDWNNFSRIYRRPGPGLRDHWRHSHQIIRDLSRILHDHASRRAHRAEN